MTGCDDWACNRNAWRKLQYATTASNSTWIVPAATTTLAGQWGTGTSAAQISIVSDSIPANPTWQILRPGEPLRLATGEAQRVELPDGAVLHLDEQGNYRLDDRNAKVIYRANRQREWNRYVSAGDVLEDFTRYAGGLGVRREEYLNLPIELFMKFLILRAAEADGEEPPEDVQLALPAPKRKAPQCLSCGRFVPKVRASASLPYCGQAHMLRYAAKMALPVGVAA